jgi:hypothetical protein
MVHDVLMLRQPDGTYVTKKSAYPKLRLAARDVCAWLGDAGFDARLVPDEPMATLVARAT